MKKLMKLATGAFAAMAFSVTAYAGDKATDAYPFRDVNLPVEQRLDDLLERLTLDEKIATLTSGFNYHGVPRLGIADVQTADGPLGIASWGIRGRGTAFPATLCLAASWDTNLAAELGAAYAREWRARGLDVLYGPGVNLSRASKSSRNFEYFGEDPYLTAEIATPFSQAVQDGGVLAVVKHFAANDQEFDRYTVSTEIDERTLHELYLYPFKKIIEQGAASAVMTGYNPLNGVYCAQNPDLLVDILRNDWGFTGTVVSDWGATHAAEASVKGGLDQELGTVDFLIADSIKPLLEAGKISIEDIDRMVANIYRPLMELGIFERIAQPDSSLPLYSPENNRLAYQEAAEGIILLKNEGDMLPQSSPRKIAVIGPNANPLERGSEYGGGGSSKVWPWFYGSDLEAVIAEFPDAEVSYAEGLPNNYLTQLFERSGVVNERSKTEYIDPVDPDDLSYRTEAPEVWETVIKPDRDGTINLFVTAQGGWRLTADGNLLADRLDAESFSNGYVGVDAHKGDSIMVKLEYRANRANPREIRFGWDYAETLDKAIAQAVAAAESADLVLFCGGFDRNQEYEGTDRTFELPFGQAEVIEALAAANKNVVVALRGGGGMATESWISDVPAVIHLTYPGQSGGSALARILSGRINPSGKLPFTMEKRWEDSTSAGFYDENRASRKVNYGEGIFMGYRGFDRDGREPLFPFGHGLSYSKFEYSDLEIKPASDSKAGCVVSFNVKNVSDRAGAEVAQLYVGDRDSSLPRPVRELKGFRRVELASGESARVEIPLSAEDFSFYSPKAHKWILEPGYFDISVGASSRDLRLKGEWLVKKPIALTRPKRH